MAEKKVKLQVYSQTGEKLSQMSVAADVFGIEPHTQTLYDAVRVYRNNARQATASTLTRAEVSGGGKKPWRQKGTGRARTGSNRSPLWVGGGNVFGPKGDQNYTIKQNRKEYRLALKSALSLKAQAQLKVLDKIELKEGKTKEINEVLKNLGTTRKVLIVVAEIDEKVALATRNIPNVKLITNQEVNVYNLLWASDVLMSEAAVKNIEEALK